MKNAEGWHAAGRRKESPSHPVLHAVALLRALAVVEAVKRADQIARDAADALKVHLFLLSAALRAAIPDNAVVAADRVAVNRVVDRAVADARVVHRAHNRFKRVEILRRIAVHLDVRDVARVRQRVIRRFQPDLVKRADRQRVFLLFGR